MADLTVTAADVVKVGTGNEGSGVAGGTITAGQPIYKDTGDADKYKAADSNASALTATVDGIALHGASDGQPIKFQTTGEIDIGATTVNGTTYVLSATAGGIAPDADSTTGWYKSVIGVGKASNNIVLSLNNSGIQV